VIEKIALGHCHATCVCFDDKAILIRGASGVGKSALALQLMGLGAQLVADDQVILDEQTGAIIAHCPKPLVGLVEVRGVGVLKTPCKVCATVSLVVDMDTAPCKRMPLHYMVEIGSHHVEAIAGEGVLNLPMAVRLLTLYGRKQS